MLALSIRQPWAWLIAQGHKHLENREWSTTQRGRILIHAGKTLTKTYYCDIAPYILRNYGITIPAPHELQLGGVVAVATLTDCIDDFDARANSLWFEGPFAFVLESVTPVPFYPFPGKLGFFHVPITMQDI